MSDATARPWSVWRRPRHTRGGWERLPESYPDRAAAFEAVRLLEWRAPTDAELTRAPEGFEYHVGGSEPPAIFPPRYLHRMMRPA